MSEQSQGSNPNPLQDRVDLTKPLGQQYFVLSLVYTPNKPLAESYELHRETFTKKPDSREEQLDICQCDTNHIANSLLYFAREIHAEWYKEYGVTAKDMVDLVCDYLLAANPEPIKNSPAVVLTIEFDPLKPKLERYAIARETTDEHELTPEEQYETMKTDIKHLANGARYFAGLMEMHFSEFGLKEKEVLGKLCVFLKTTIKGSEKELDIIT